MLYETKIHALATLRRMKKNKGRKRRRRRRRRRRRMVKKCKKMKNNNSNLSDDCLNDFLAFYCLNRFAFYFVFLAVVLVVLAVKSKFTNFLSFV